MSNATREAIGAAIQAHLHDEEDQNALVTDWTVVIAAIGPEHGDYKIGIANSRDPMPTYIAKGLLTDALDDLRDGYYEANDDD